MENLCPHFGKRFAERWKDVQPEEKQEYSVDDRLNPFKTS